jgi:hypothetical protein
LSQRITFRSVRVTQQIESAIGKRWVPIAKSFFGGIIMNAVGIDVSKGKSMVSIMRQFGEVVASPFEVAHTDSELRELANSLKSLNGETKVVMECTGNYYYPIAFALHDAGLFVSAVHAKLIHDYGNNSIRKVKTDRKDSIKIANYALSHWLELQQFFPEEDIRIMLKAFSRQYSKYIKLKVMLKNNFIALTDFTFPTVSNRSFIFIVQNS